MAHNTRTVATVLSLSLVFGIGVVAGALLTAHKGRRLALVQPDAEVEGGALKTTQTVPRLHVVTNEQVIVRTEIRYAEDPKIAEIDFKVGQQDAAVWPEYETLLANLGFNAAQMLYVRTNLMQMHRLAIRSGDPLLELAMLRQKFDETLAKELPRETYTAFKNHETQKPAAFEVQQIRDHIAKQGGESDPTQEKQVMEVVWEAGLARSISWSGPYDPIPQPMVGDETFGRLLEADIKAIEDNTENLRDKLINKGVSEEYASKVIGYYNQRLDRKRESLRFVRMTPEEKDAYRKRQILERHKLLEPEAAEREAGKK